MGKYADEVVKSVNEVVYLVAREAIKGVLAAIELNKATPEAWPITFELGKIVPKNQRELQAVFELLDAEYGFVSYMAGDDQMVVDLPNVSNEEFPQAQEEPVRDELLSASEATKIAEKARISGIETLFKPIDKLIRDAAAKGNNSVEVVFKDKPISGDLKSAKRVYQKLVSLGFDCNSGLKLDVSGQPKFSDMQSIMVRWK